MSEGGISIAQVRQQVERARMCVSVIVGGGGKVCPRFSGVVLTSSCTAGSVGYVFRTGLEHRITHRRRRQAFSRAAGDLFTDGFGSCVRKPML